MSGEQRQEDVPFDRLTRICDDMVGTLERHPEQRDGIDKAIILLDDDTSGGLVRYGYDDGPEGDLEVAHRLLEHARAIHELNGIPFRVMHLPRGEG